MSASKRYINKEDVLKYLDKENVKSLLRQVKIDMLFNSEMLVLDMWTSKFYNELNPSERKIRKKLDDKYKFNSGFEFIQDEDYSGLKSMSEALISLMCEDASWLDIHVVLEKFRPDVTADEIGKYDLLRKKCINLIIEYFN
jgi:hypothetical protein